MFNKVSEPTKHWNGYDANNPNILERVVYDLESGNPFHYLFTGVVGCGKTYLGKLVTASSGEMWKYVMVRKHYMQYLEYIQSSYTDKWEAIKGLNNIFNSRCLMVDDLGDEKPSTEASHDYFGGLLEMRYTYLNRNDDISRTIITTNLGSEDMISLYGSRVSDRIHEHFVICRFNPTSFRESGVEILES